MKVSRAGVAVLGLIHAAAAFANAASGLTPDQKKQLNAGKFVSIVEPVEGHAWPRIRAIQLLKTTPEAAAAVFWDFEDTKNVAPDVTESFIARRLARNVVEVTFVTDLPFPLGKDHSTFRETLTSPATDTYAVNWTLVESNNASKVEGGVRFEPVGNDTLMSYSVLVTPSSGAAALIAKKATQKTVDGVRNTFSVIEKTHSQVAKERAEIEVLRRALGN